MKIKNILIGLGLGLTFAASKVVVGATATTEVLGGTTEYVSWGLKNTFATTEVIGKGVKVGSKYVKEQFQDLNDFSRKQLEKQEYRNLNDTYNWRGKVVEGDWILVNKFQSK